MNTWPTSILPDPRTDYSLKKEPAVIRTSMDSGRTRQRQRFTTDIAKISVKWCFSEFQWMLFQSFHKHKISLGADYFLVDLWFGQGVTQVKARFVNGGYNTVYSNGKYVVSATLEVEEQPILSEDYYDLIVVEGGGEAAVEAVEDASDELHELVHVTLPDNLD